MRYYFAPMEGVTDSVYRRLHHACYGGVDRYYMPFLSPTIHRTLTNREERELPLADSVPFTAVPQILTKNAQDFLWAAQVCRDRGYDEVNLNIGCPSGTVVSKGKGSGMLRSPGELDAFFEEIFRDPPLPISVKTRLGLESADEFPALMDVFNRYPIQELTIHPRVRKAFYNGPVEEAAFQYAWENSKNPLCYNGNLLSPEDCHAAANRYPGLEAVMLGRALIGDPGMLVPEKNTPENLKIFHDSLLEEYTRIFGSARNAMFRMKENWHYLHLRFDGSEKLWKRLRKTTDIDDYRSVTAEIFQTLPCSPALRADW